MAQAGPDSGVVTPEAVRLELDTAGVGSRAVALLLDLTAQGSVLAVLAVAAALLPGAGAGLPPWAGATLVLLLGFAVVWGYPIAFETLWRGRTPGKAVMGLRVVTSEGAPVGVRHAALRAALGLVDFYLTSGAAAVIAASVTRRHQRLGDLAAGTVVLRERSGQGPVRAVRFAVPAGAEGYAATLDAAGLSARDYAVVRAFLLRAPTLAPAVREELADKLARPLARRLAHRPPAGVDPELFLRCVAARYQQRGAGPPRAGRPADGAPTGGPGERGGLTPPG